MSLSLDLAPDTASWPSGLSSGSCVSFPGHLLGFFSSSGTLTPFSASFSAATSHEISHLLTSVENLTPSRGYCLPCCLCRCLLLIFTCLINHMLLTKTKFHQENEELDFLCCDLLMTSLFLLNIVAGYIYKGSIYKNAMVWRVYIKIVYQIKCLFVEDSKMYFSANIILEDESKYVKSSIANSH